MNRRVLVIGVLVAIGVGLGAVTLLRRMAPAPAPAVKDAATSATPSPAPGAAPAATRADEPPPPWAAASPASTTSPQGSTTSNPSDDPERAARMRAVQQSVQGIVRDATQRSDASHARLREALDALQALDDPRVNAKINLPAVRHNLEVSVRMQALTREFQQALAQPVGPERDARVEAITQQFRALQSQLRTDVQVGGAAPGTAE